MSTISTVQMEPATRARPLTSGVQLVEGNSENSNRIVVLIPSAEEWLARPKRKAGPGRCEEVE